MFKSVPLLNKLFEKNPVKAKYMRSKEPLVDSLGRNIYRMMRVPSSKYTAGGARPNVRGTFVRNPKVAAQINEMHQKWLGGTSHGTTGCA